MNVLLRASATLAALLISAGAVAAYHSTSTYQVGPPGVAMQVTETNIRLGDRLAANAVPPPLPPASADGELAVNAYKNVQVLGHISSGEFTRLMTAMTTWVAPQQGCAYCHAPKKDAQGNIEKDEEGYPVADNNNLQSDELYTKRVARRMIQMTLHLNGDWKQHVKETGVTCYTCHRGQPVPQNIWWDQPEGAHDEGMVGAKAGQNAPAVNAGLSSLPSTAFRPFLASDEQIRVIGTDALPSNNRSSVKQTEWTYALMMHMSNSLGVNCTYCHNSRSMAEWSSSPPARTTAWYGIRMVRDINLAYLEPLRPEFPQQRLGVLGDAPKVNCATCHQGAFKPLLGVSMLKDYHVLAEAKPQPLKAKAATEPVPGADGDAGTTMAAADAGDSGLPAFVKPDVAGQDAGGAPNPAFDVDAGATKMRASDAGPAGPVPPGKK